jgi:tetratricopeptide (TPR) repeat protein
METKLSPRHRKNQAKKGSSFLAAELTADTERLQLLHDEVKHLLKCGCIRQSTLEKVKELNRFVNDNETALRSGDEFHFLKSKCMIAEVFDQFGLIKEAEQIVQEGEEFLKQIQTDAPVKVKEDKYILREKVRLCLNYAQVIFYRNHNYDEAEKIILRCRDFVESVLKDEKEFQCFGTIAQINYYLGRVYRQKTEYAAAEACFALSMENYYHRADQRVAKFRSDSLLCNDPVLLDKMISEELAFATHRSGIVLALGIGWMGYARGHLTKALYNNIIPARVMLLHAQDEQLSTAYLHLIYASILRALFGRDEKGLKPAIEEAEKAYEVFRVNNHRRYMARAAFELCLAYFNNDRLDEAERSAREVEAISREVNDHRWLCHSLILRSRIERQRADSLDGSKRREKNLKGEKIASEAYEKAKTYNQVLCQIDSLLTRAGARIDLKKTEEAREDLEKVLELNAESGSHKRTEAGNPKIDAVCYLYIARSWVREREGARAKEYFQRWKDLEKEVEHSYVRDLADKVGKEISLLHRGFVIEADPEMELSYKTHLKDLRRFLIDQAKLIRSDKKGVASLLGITRQTLHEWEREIE